MDNRQVELAFNGCEGIAAVLSNMGDRVSIGQVLARLNTERLAPKAAEAAAQQQAVKRLCHRSQPDEIDQARANVSALDAYASNARDKYVRPQVLAQSSTGRALRLQDQGDAKSTAHSAAAHLTVSLQALRLDLIGPRRKDIAQAEVHFAFW